MTHTHDLKPALRIAGLALLLCAPPALADAPFVVNGDGTVTDTSTGLMWDRCPIG